LLVPEGQFLFQEPTVNRSQVFVSALFFLLLAAAVPAVAQTKGTVTFGGLKNLEFVNDYYNGGQGSLGSGPGKNFHLQFSSNAQAIVQAAKGGSGNFINNPGNYPVMFFQTGNSAAVTASDGVHVALWFFYSAVQPGTATVYDGPNGTGNILASITLSPNDSGCTTYKLCVWSAVGVPLSTPAGSIRFSGNANYLAIGAMHLGQKLPTSTVLTSSPNPSMQGQAVTLTAVVSSTAGALPAGTVTFKAENAVIGQVALVNGAASITVSSFPPGSTRISATFKGASFATSSAKLVQVVN
jgi:hypothetical protein